MVNYKVGLSFGIIILFVLSAITPIVFGVNITAKEQSAYHIDPLRDYYSCYNLKEIPKNIRPIVSEEEENQDIPEKENIVNLLDSYEPINGPPMDSAWPMYCHDTRHTGRSPYHTTENPGEKWRFRCGDWVEGGGVIDKNGIIYFSGGDENEWPHFFAVYPNGTLKWKYKLDWPVQSAPAIADDGTIYAGVESGKLYSITPNGILNWKLSLSGEIYSSPAIGPDGTIYIGDGGYYINAINPNGTFKWRYKTGLVVYSSPAIGDDGTVYCGSHDTYLYAFYPNNGTIKWKYKTGHWIRTSPCVGDDGTIYCVSLDNYLHAVYPNNGTRKWRTNVGAGTSPTIGQDGTIYCGYSKLFAINPINGSVKWTFDVPHNLRGGTPCNSVDGTIYVGTNVFFREGGEFVAVNPNGTLKWRSRIGPCEFAPIIGEDGTVYVGSSNSEVIESGNWDYVLDYGYLHAFGPGDKKSIEITKPNPNRFYFYNFDLGLSRSGDSIIFGYVKVIVDVNSVEELESVEFYAGNWQADGYIHLKLYHNDTEPPFEWLLDIDIKKNLWFLPFWDWKRLRVVAKYKGGCEWMDNSMSKFLYIKFRN